MIDPQKIRKLPKLNYCEQGDKIFVKPGVYPMSSRKLEGFIKIANLQKYYQCNPVRFINDFFNIELKLGSFKDPGIVLTFFLFVLVDSENLL